MPKGPGPYSMGMIDQDLAALKVRQEDVLRRVDALERRRAEDWPGSIDHTRHIAEQMLDDRLTGIELTIAEVRKIQKRMLMLIIASFIAQLLKSADIVTLLNMLK